MKQTHQNSLRRLGGCLVCVTAMLALLTACGTSQEQGAAAAPLQSALNVAEATQEPSPEAASQTLAADAAQSAVTDIGLEAAQAAALADAGVTAEEATITEAHLDQEHGKPVYEIEFYTGQTEYEYEVDAATGEIRYKGVEHGAGAANPTSASGDIGVDQAKAIALEHAGLTGQEVTYSKAKLENDDGCCVYEIEFYHGTEEYEYCIDASSGSILDFEHDQEHTDDHHDAHDHDHD